MALLEDLLWDYLTYPPPIYFGVDESCTWLCFYSVWVSCWHMPSDFNADLAVPEGRAQDEQLHNQGEPPTRGTSASSGQCRISGRVSPYFRFTSHLRVMDLNARMLHICHRPPPWPHPEWPSPPWRKIYWRCSGTSHRRDSKLPWGCSRLWWRILSQRRRIFPGRCAGFALTTQAARRGWEQKTSTSG